MLCWVFLKPNNNVKIWWKLWWWYYWWAPYQHKTKMTGSKGNAPLAQFIWVHSPSTLSVIVASISSKIIIDTWMTSVCVTKMVVKSCKLYLTYVFTQLHVQTTCYKNFMQKVNDYLPYEIVCSKPSFLRDIMRSKVMQRMQTSLWPVISYEMGGSALAQVRWYWRIYLRSGLSMVVSHILSNMTLFWIWINLRKYELTAVSRPPFLCGIVLCIPMNW